MVILLLGAYRFWRQQNAILRGKVHVGGWEVNAVGVTVSTVCDKHFANKIIMSDIFDR